MDHVARYSDVRVYTIGHSSHPLEIFTALLKLHQIEIVADVRSTPHSAHAPQFNREVLPGALKAHGLRYVFLGDALGGRPADKAFYDGEGFVRYDWLAASPDFLHGIERLMEGIRKYCVVLLCSEEYPRACHRRRLVGRVLREAGVHVLHIRHSGEVEPEERLMAEEQSARDKGQRLLFGLNGSQQWRSAQSLTGPGKARQGPDADLTRPSPDD